MQTHTLLIFSSCCFPTVTMVMRTRSVLHCTYITRVVQSLTTAVYGGVWGQHLPTLQRCVLYRYESSGGVQTRLEIRQSMSLLRIVWL